MRVLIVKTSSLGDLVHTLPALTDARRVYADVTFDWLAEKSFAEIPAWHPAVDRVITCETRRWRKNLWQTRRSGEWAQFKAQLRERDYYLVLDAQGLFKSAVLASQARGPLAGPGWAGARDRIAPLFYGRRLAVPRVRDAHAVERVRALFAQALGYAKPDTAPDFGLDRAHFPVAELPRPYLVFLHATTWPTKCWPENHWQELGRALHKRGFAIVLPWGNEAERATATRIAAEFGGIVLPKMRLTELAGVLAHARAVVGVDTGLAHVAAVVATPSITLYGPTLPGLTGTVGQNQLHLSSTDAVTVDRGRPNTVAVQRVLDALNPLLTA
ncbi:MAG: lipopolysaccharide heptosyltransferase I [Stenotrophobium sp.]